MNAVEQRYFIELVKCVGIAAELHRRARGKVEDEVTKAELAVEQASHRLEDAQLALVARQQEAERTLRTHYAPKNAGWTQRNYWTPERRRAAAERSRQAAFDRIAQEEVRRARRSLRDMVDHAEDERRRSGWLAISISDHQAKVRRRRERREERRRQRALALAAERRQRAWDEWLASQAPAVREADQAFREAARRSQINREGGPRH